MSSAPKLKNYPFAYPVLKNNSKVIAQPSTPAPARGHSEPVPVPVPPVVIDPLLGLDLWGFNTYGTLGGITSITFNTTQSIPGFIITSDTELLSLYFPNLVSVDPNNLQGGLFFIIGNTSLTTLSMPVFVPTAGRTYALSGNALDATSVNGFMARCVANAAFTSGTVDLSGGTSAAPSGQGATDKTALTNRGVTVVTN